MPLPADRPAARHVREPGTPPRSLVVLASVALVTGTGVALWLLPGKADEHLAGPGRPAPAKVTVPPPAIRPADRPAPDRPAVDRRPGRHPGRLPRPSGFVSFVETAPDPHFTPAKAAVRSRVRRLPLGHLAVGGGGCIPGWGDRRDPAGGGRFVLDECLQWGYKWVITLY